MKYLALTFLALSTTACGGDGGATGTPAPEPDMALPLDMESDAAPGRDAREVPMPSPDMEVPDEPDVPAPPLGACGELPFVDMSGDALLLEDDGSFSAVGLSEAMGSSLAEGACGGPDGSEAAFRFVADEAGTYRIYAAPLTAGDFDTIVYARTGCLDADSELACNDDLAFPDDTNSRIVIDLDAGQEVFLIVDAWVGMGSARGGDLFVNVKKIDRIQRDVACDPLVLNNACLEGDFCFLPPSAPQSPDDDPPPETSACIEDTAPTLTGGQAFRIGSTATFTVTGTDASRDVDSLYVVYRLDGEVLVDVAGDPAEATLAPLPSSPVHGQAEFTFRTSADFATLLGMDVIPDGVTVIALDSQGNESEPLDLPLVDAPELQPDGVCDAFRLLDHCPMGTACKDVVVPSMFTCTAITAPTLTSAVAHYNLDNGRISVELLGVDLEGDIDRPGITLLDEEMADLPLRQDGMPGEALGTFAPGQVTVDEMGAYRAVWQFTLLDENRLAFPIGTVRVRMHDVEGLVSEAIDATLVEPTRDLELGAPCDPFEALNACNADALCGLEMPGDALGLCEAIVRECPADFMAVNLNDHGVAPDWRFDGTTVEAASHGRGTCGGGAGDQPFTFTAPEDGDYSFLSKSDDEGADTLMYLREACGYAGPEFPSLELACNDDQAEDNTEAAFDISLSMGQTVYVFVDGFRGTNDATGWQGTYTLVVRQLR